MIETTDTPSRMRPHRVLREVLRHYLEFERLCGQQGHYNLDYAGFDINFSDLKGCLKDLSPRKKQAIYYNVICDMRQKDVAELMGITPISVGQYVDKALREIAPTVIGEASP